MDAHRLQAPLSVLDTIYAAVSIVVLANLHHLVVLVAGDAVAVVTVYADVVGLQVVAYYLVPCLGTYQCLNGVQGDGCTADIRQTEAVVVVGLQVVFCIHQFCVSAGCINGTGISLYATGTCTELQSLCADVVAGVVLALVVFCRHLGEVEDARWVEVGRQDFDVSSHSLMVEFIAVLQCSFFLSSLIAILNGGIYR